MTVVGLGERPADTAAAPSGYRPHLDGIRTVAVYLVVLFHAGIGEFSGGFVGVDVFFVLSGYLVTQVLLRDLDGHGTIRFARFYARRIRRLLPALIVALLVTTAAYAGVATPAAVASLGEATRASLLYFANWFFIGESTDYFAREIDTSPVLHVWSLAVEEQFYLLWPLVFGGLWLATRRLPQHSRRALALIVAGGAVTSLLWALALRSDQPSRAYFGTDARAYQLLAGALLALLPGLVVRGRSLPLARLLAPAGMAAVIMLATSMIDLDPIVRGIAVTAGAVALILGLEAVPGGLLARLLSTGSFVFLGKISYATYIWHWPVIIIARELDTTPAPIPLAAITFLVATGIAALSYQLVEMPVRQWPTLDRHRVAVIGTGLAASIASALLIVPALTDAERGSTVVAQGAAGGFTAIPASFDHGAVYSELFGETVECVDAAPEDCTVVDGPGRHVLLMGDSNALMLVPAFTEMAKAEGLRLSLSVTAGCPWQRDYLRLGAEIRATCRRNKADAYERVIPALDPDLIVLVNVRFPEIPDEFDRSERSSQLRETTEASLSTLSTAGRDVVLVKPMARPADDFDPLACLAKADFVEECRFVVPDRDPWLDAFEQELANRSDAVTFVDWDRLVCPFLPICDPMIGGIPVYWNQAHITTRYSESLAGPVADELRVLGLI